MSSAKGRYTKGAASGPASMASQTADVKQDPDQPAPQKQARGMFAAGNTLGTPAAAGGNGHPPAVQKVDNRPPATPGQQDMPATSAR